MVKRLVYKLIYIADLEINLQTDGRLRDQSTNWYTFVSVAEINLQTDAATR